MPLRNRKGAALIVAAALLSALYSTGTGLAWSISKSAFESRLAQDLSLTIALYRQTDLPTFSTSAADLKNENATFGATRISLVDPVSFGLRFDTAAGSTIEGGSKAPELSHPFTAIYKNSSVTPGQSLYYASAVIANATGVESYVRVSEQVAVGMGPARLFTVIATPVFAFALVLCGLMVWMGLRTETRPLVQAVAKLAATAGEDLGGLNIGKSSLLMASALVEAEQRLAGKIAESSLAGKKTAMILDSITQGFLAFSASGEIVMENDRAVTILGNRPDLKGPTFDSRLKEAANEVLKDGKPRAFDWEHGNRTYAVSLVGYALDDDPKPSGIALVFDDVTEQRRLEQAKIDFFAYAGHELKSPLTSIIGYQEMIKDGIITDKGEIAKALDRSLGQAREMRDIIRDMLDISALESRKPRDIGPVDLADTARETIVALKPLAMIDGVRLIADLRPLRVLMNAQDAVRLIRNLVENAIKYNKSGGMVYLRTDADKRTLEVVDNGIGMYQEDVKRCFERFYRVKGTHISGSGLGLAIVKHICSYYGFGVDVASKLGQGSTFTISFGTHMDS